MPSVAYASGSAPTEDVRITASGDNIADADGLGAFGWQWSAADTNGGAYANISGATNAAFTPGDDEVGKFLRVCASFMDMAATPNMEKRCLQIATAVANINDKPLATSFTIAVRTAASAADPYRLRPTDFTFRDADNDMLASVVIHGLPAAGTMSLDGTALTADDVPTAEITVVRLTAGALTYYPESGQEPTNPSDSFEIYTSFRFGVTDDGSDGTGNNASDNIASISIRLVSAVQTAASGSLITLPLPNGVGLSANTVGIRDPNGINRNTLMYEWQQSAASDGPFAPIEGATSREFTPRPGQLNQYIRVCVTFMDQHTPPAEEGPLCSAAVRVGPIRLRLRIFLEGPLR